MKITGFETFLANAGLRNYLFIRLRTDTGLTGIGEATLEWQETTVQTLLHEWVEGRVLGRDPFDIEAVDRRHDPRPVPGRLDGDDGDQRRRDRALGLDRQGVRPAGLSPAGRPMPRPHPRLRQRLVWRGAHAGEFAERAAARGRARVSRAQVRPVRDGLEGARAEEAERPSRRSRRSGRPSGPASA